LISRRIDCYLVLFCLVKMYSSRNAAVSWPCSCDLLQSRHSSLAFNVHILDRRQCAGPMSSAETLADGYRATRSDSSCLWLAAEIFLYLLPPQRGYMTSMSPVGSAMGLSAISQVAAFGWLAIISSLVTWLANRCYFQHQK